VPVAKALPGGTRPDPTSGELERSPLQLCDYRAKPFRGSDLAQILLPIWVIADHRPARIPGERNMGDRKQHQHEDHQYHKDSDTLAFPDHTVVGIVDDPEATVAVIEGLMAEGIPEEEIAVLYGESGARRLDPTGERHGILGRLRRLVQHYGDQERPHVKRQAEELQAGNFLILFGPMLLLGIQQIKGDWRMSEEEIRKLFPFLPQP
jgi:hypothetical protein